MNQLIKEQQNVEGCCTPTASCRSAALFQPAVDIVENDGAVALFAEMPGVSEKTLNIQVERNVLTIEGETEALEFEGHRPLRREYAEGRFRRTFKLSNDVDVDKIEASIADGVVKVVLPKAARAVARKIPVKHESSH